MITFNGIELKNPEPFDRSPIIRCSETILASGESSVQSSSETGLQIKIKCSTDSYSNISSLFALIGGAYTLVIDSTSHTNCTIKSWDQLEQDPGGTWWYALTFVQDTTS